MDVFKTHGAFSWSELSCADPQAAGRFYAELFGWQLESMPMPGGEYTLAKLNGQAIAGLMRCPDGDGAGAGAAAWGCYVTVDSVDVAVQRCTALGGTVLVPPMDVPTVGRMALLRDPQGACINVIQYEPAQA